MKISIKVQAKVLIAALEKRLAFFKQDAEKNKKVFDAENKKQTDASLKSLEKILSSKTVTNCSISHYSTDTAQKHTKYTVHIEIRGPAVDCPSDIGGFQDHRYSINVIENALKVLRLNPEAMVNTATHSDVLPYL
jgi:hypothetical protein